jgi:hypothetical protein
VGTVPPIKGVSALLGAAPHTPRTVHQLPSVAKYRCGGVHTRRADAPSAELRHQLSERRAARLMQNLSLVIRPFTAATPSATGILSR